VSKRRNGAGRSPPAPREDYSLEPEELPEPVSPPSEEGAAGVSAGAGSGAGAGVGTSAIGGAGRRLADVALRAIMRAAGFAVLRAVVLRAVVLRAVVLRAVVLRAVVFLATAFAGLRAAAARAGLRAVAFVALRAGTFAFVALARVDLVGFFVAAFRTGFFAGFLAAAFRTGFFVALVAMLSLPRRLM
jgi:hypothetical protein